MSSETSRVPVYSYKCMLDRFLPSWQITAVVYFGINIPADILLCGEQDSCRTILKGFLMAMTVCILLLNMMFTLQFFC